MQLKPRSLLATFGLLLAPVVASAQDIELVTEAPVTFELTFGTSIPTTTGVGTPAGRTVTTRSYNSKAGNADIIAGFVPSLIPSTTGWRLVAVRPLAGDMIEVDGTFFLYLVNDDANQRIPVPSNRFLNFRNATVTSATTTHSTRNVSNTVASSGIMTDHTTVLFNPSFVRKEEPAVIIGSGTNTIGRYTDSRKTISTFDISALSIEGFTTIAFATRPTEPVFSFAISNMVYTARGDFSGTYVNSSTDTRTYAVRGVSPVITPVTPPDATVYNGSGLVSARITVSPAKLADRTRYPAVSF